ncbi:MAG: ThuA domain-containing protein, partial [Spartobacteria bacterium]
DNRIDAVIFCNTSGPLPLPDAQGFSDWVRSGGAFIGMHAGSDTLKDSLPYTGMLCGTFDGHGPQVPATLHAGDKEHPANGNIGDIWTLSQEEMYLIKNHDRDKVRSIWFMRHHPNKPEEKGFFPVAWVRGLGEGRVFYTSLGHREDIWSIDPALPKRLNSIETASQFRSHLLGGIRWALGLAPGSADPNPTTN